MSVVIDKLSELEMKLLIDITIKKNTIKENIRQLVEMEMQLDIEQRETIAEIMKNHGLDMTTGYQFLLNGEITL
jgi:hypothetical protein